MSDITIKVGADVKGAVDQLNDFFRAYNQGIKQAQDAEQELRKNFKDRKVKYDVQFSVEGGEVAAKTVKRISTNTDKAKQAASALNDKWKQTPASLKKQLSIIRLNLTK